MGSHYLCERGDLLGRVGALVGFDWGTKPEHRRDECPRRWVEIPEPLWIATTEVTNLTYEQVIYEEDRRDKYSSQDEQPAVYVSFWGAKRFCRELDDSLEEYDFRLPTEEEWEYACRAGSTAEYFFGDDPAALGDYATYEKADSPFPWSSENRPGPVRAHRPNPWGLYDILGNVWEWTSSPGPSDDETRVIRGGGCRSGTGDLRSATRRWTVRGRRIAFLGFRPVMVERNEEDE
jgi:formylglycine-generating enzyme required for sulfatase activity